MYKQPWPMPIGRLAPVANGHWPLLLYKPYTSDTHWVKAPQCYTAIQRYTARCRVYSYTSLYTVHPLQHPSAVSARCVPPTTDPRPCSSTFSTRSADQLIAAARATAGSATEAADQLDARVERPAAVGRSVGGEQHLPGLIRLGFGLGLGLGLGLRFGCWFSTGK